MQPAARLCVLLIASRAAPAAETGPAVGPHQDPLAAGECWPDELLLLQLGVGIKPVGAAVGAAKNVAAPFQGATAGAARAVEDGGRVGFAAAVPAAFDHVFAEAIVDRDFPVITGMEYPLNSIDAVKVQPVTRTTEVTSSAVSSLTGYHETGVARATADISTSFRDMSTSNVAGAAKRVPSNATHAVDRMGSSLVKVSAELVEAASEPAVPVAGAAKDVRGSAKAASVEVSAGSVELVSELGDATSSGGLKDSVPDMVGDVGGSTRDVTGVTKAEAPVSELRRVASSVESRSAGSAGVASGVISHTAKTRDDVAYKAFVSDEVMKLLRDSPFDAIADAVKNIGSAVSGFISQAANEVKEHVLDPISKVVRDKVIQPISHTLDNILKAPSRSVEAVVSQGIDKTVQDLFNTSRTS